MSGASQDGTADDRAEEARNLAEEAVEAMEDGEPEEAKFLAAEAKALDKAAAEAVLNADEAEEAGKEDAE